MLVKVGDQILNTDHILKAEWVTHNKGTASETKTLQVTVAYSQNYLPIGGENAKKLWEFLVAQAQEL